MGVNLGETRGERGGNVVKLGDTWEKLEGISKIS